MYCKGFKCFDITKIKQWINKHIMNNTKLILYKYAKILIIKYSIYTHAGLQMTIPRKQEDSNDGTHRSGNGKRPNKTAQEIINHNFSFSVFSFNNVIMETRMGY